MKGAGEGEGGRGGATWCEKHCLRATDHEKTLSGKGSAPEPQLSTHVHTHHTTQPCAVSADVYVACRENDIRGYHFLLFFLKKKTTHIHYEFFIFGCHKYQEPLSLLPPPPALCIDVAMLIKIQLPWRENTQPCRSHLLAYEKAATTLFFFCNMQYSFVINN